MITAEELEQSVRALDLREQAYSLIFEGLRVVPDLAPCPADVPLKLWQEANSPATAIVASIENKLDFLQMLGLIDATATPRSLQRASIHELRQIDKNSPRPRNRATPKAEIKKQATQKLGLMLLTLRIARFHYSKRRGAWRYYMSELYVQAMELDGFLNGVMSAYDNRTAPAIKARKSQGEQRKAQVMHLYNRGNFRSKGAAAWDIAQQTNLSYERVRKLLREPKA
jgi:hypothetical protein